MTMTKNNSAFNPNKCLNDIQLARAMNGFAIRACQQLNNWLAAGKSEPDWAHYPLGTIRYEKWLTEYHENN